ncbi:hypothetical protein MJO28_012013, partial [Puccinia striiformis f. sp. tritici]
DWGALVRGISDEVWGRCSPGPVLIRAYPTKSASMPRLVVLLTSDTLTRITRTVSHIPNDQSLDGSSGLWHPSDIERRSNACPLETCSCSCNPGVTSHYQSTSRHRPLCEPGLAWHIRIHRFQTRIRGPKGFHHTSTESNELRQTSTKPKQSQLSEGDKHKESHSFNACDIQAIDSATTNVSLYTPLFN